MLEWTREKRRRRGSLRRLGIAGTSSKRHFRKKDWVNKTFRRQRCEKNFNPVKFATPAETLSINSRTKLARPTSVTYDDNQTWNQEIPRELAWYNRIRTPKALKVTGSSVVENVTANRVVISLTPIWAIFTFFYSPIFCLELSAPSKQCAFPTYNLDNLVIFVSLDL